MKGYAEYLRATACLGLVLGVLCLHGTPALGRTWQVTKAGNGDFLVIQDAVDAAADGDTIIIAAGRYDDFTWIQLGNSLQYVYCGKSLAFVGAGANLTVIGKEDPDFIAPQVNQSGIDIEISVGAVSIEGIGFENIRHGYSIGSSSARLKIVDCSFVHCSRGINATAPMGIVVRNCSFTDIGLCPISTDGYTVILLPPTTNAVVEDCNFVDCFSGVDCNWPDTRNVSVINCNFIGGTVAVSFITGASGTVRNSHLEGQSRWGIVGSEAGNVVIEDNTITVNHPGGGATGFGNFFTGGSIILRRNVITASGTNTCLDLNVSNLNFLARNNHFLRADGPGLKCTAIGGPYGIDVRENWWGTTDPQEIADSIHDLLDDPGLQYQYLFEPFLGQPVATEKKSLGSLKMLFR